MSSENNFFLKSFFKDEGLKETRFDIIWDKLSLKTQVFQKKIEKNIKKMGDFELKNSSPLTPKEIYKEYQNLWNTKGTLEGIRSKKLKNYFQILFANPNEGVAKGLYDNTEQFDDFFNTLIKKNKQNFLKRLFEDLLYHYPIKLLFVDLFSHYPTDKLFFTRLKKVYNNLDKQKRSHQALIQANVEFCFTEKDSPKIIAKNILDIQQDLSFVLSKLWLKERHLISNGIGEAIVTELSYMVKKFVQEENEPVIKRFLDYLYGKNNINRFISPKLITKALLRPFENKEPNKKSVKKRITKILDQHVGDPRSKSKRWINMEKEKSIFLKWKIGETLKDFFDLLSYTSEQDFDADRMWPYRKEFIEAYQKEGHIKEAWIVLGKEAYNNRSDFLKEEHDGFGKLIRGVKPIHSFHSVLLFQIGDLILSEWNYNGPVRLWDSNKNSPQFYKKEYTKEELVKKAKKQFKHHSSRTYFWQRELSYYIEQYTGIPCPKDLRRKIDEHR